MFKPLTYRSLAIIAALSLVANVIFFQFFFIDDMLSFLPHNIIGAFIGYVIAWIISVSAIELCIRAVASAIKNKAIEQE